MERAYHKPHSVKIGGQTFPLAFPLKALIEMQNNIKDFDMGDLGKVISQPQGLLDVLYILAESGAKLNGEKLEVSKEWMALRIPANIRKLVAIQIEVMNTLTDGMSMETEDDEDSDREVDVVLAEIQKKSEKTDSPGEKSQPGD